MGCDPPPLCNRVVQKSLFFHNPQQQQQQQHKLGSVLDLSATAAGKNGWRHDDGRDAPSGKKKDLFPLSFFVPPFLSATCFSFSSCRIIARVHRPRGRGHNELLLRSRRRTKLRVSVSENGGGGGKKTAKKREATCPLAFHRRPFLSRGVE